MNKLEQRCNFYMYEVPDHRNTKEKILEGIAAMGTHSVVQNDQQIKNTDWHLNQNHVRPYFEHLQHIMNAHASMLMQITMIPQDSWLNVQNYWFQQYGEGDYHGWHMHANSVFSNIYYVDLPEGASKTTFKLGNETFEVPVQEGHIITFPSCFLHCSLPNKEATKTIISFNY